MANGGQRFSLFPPLGSGTAPSTVQPTSLLLVDQPTPGGGYTTQVATAAQVASAYWNNGISSQSAGMVSWNGSLLLTRTIVAASSNITVNNGNGSANPGIDLSTSLNFSATTVSGGTFNGPVLVNPTISGLSFSGTTISGGTWINGTLTGFINATGATLSGATLQGATFTGTILDSGTISGGTVSGATILNGTQTGLLTIAGILAGGTVSGAVHQNGSVSGVVTGGTLSGQVIQGATITGSTLSGYALVTVGSVPATIPSGRQIVQGTNVTITDNGAGGTLVISVSGVGTGTVTLVGTQSGLTGGPISATGSIGLLAQASVASGNYTNATVSVNSFGIVTGIAVGAAAGTDMVQIQVFM